MTMCSNKPLRARERSLATALLGLLVCLAGGSPLAAAAQTSPSHMHEPLQIDASLDWAALVEDTVRQYPSFVELASRDAEAAALLDRGRSWLSGQPALNARYQSDGTLDDAGLREYELGIELPLWRPGQRSSAKALGSAATLESRAAATALRHEVIGLLRTVLWDIEKAARAKALADDGVGVANELLRVVQRRYEAGELPMTDVLLAQSAVMRREAIVIAADAAVVDAERGYRSLTGRDVRPVAMTEQLSASEDFDDSHPALQLANADLERARAELDLTAQSAGGTPRLTIGPRREQAPLSTLTADSLGVSVSMPFGGRAQRNVQIAAANRRVAAAEAARAMLVRRLDLGLHEVQHTLVVIEASLELARQRRDLADTHLQLSQTAFVQGEMTLFELLQQQEAARLTQHEVAQLEVERESTIAQINHALGEWP